MPRANTVRRVLTRPVRHGDRVRVVYEGVNNSDVSERQFNEGDEYLLLTDAYGNDLEFYAENCVSIEILPPAEPIFGSVVIAGGVAWQRSEESWHAVTGAALQWADMVSFGDLKVVHVAE